MFHYETEALQKGFQIIIGVDEAGRGPLAGPVVSAAVYLKSFKFDCKIGDSKTLSAKARHKAFLEIYEKAHIGVGIMSEAVIDEVNVLQASYLAMSKAVEQLIDRLPDSQRGRTDFISGVCLLVDGPDFRSNLPYFSEAIVDGDALSFSIACASIIAKVTRDRILEKYDRILPQYGFARHKGYPTRAHKLAIQQNGLSFIHRRTFHCGLSQSPGTRPNEDRA